MYKNILHKKQIAVQCGQGGDCYYTFYQMMGMCGMMVVCRLWKDDCVWIVEGRLYASVVM